tara:strand:+ start:3797 stop:5227 length:1431 start_codon:yes stop_codon:yes gene_type:complete
LHYDSASRILKGELPVRDYWIVSGLTVDFIQSIFFKIFGVNWFAYTIHSSLFNSLISAIVYVFFLKLEISKIKSFIYALSFATLSYTISGTPFVDLHATYFLLISTLLISCNLSSSQTYIWPTIIFLFFLSFLSKQVPAAYAGIVYAIILTIFFITKKDYKKIIINLILIASLFILFYLFLSYFKIDYKNFFIQYIDYPRSIGSNRIFNFEITFVSIFNKFKFVLVPLFYLIFIKFRSKDSIEKKFEFFIFASFTIIMLFHQLLTKNQIYIYFLIPLLFAFLEKELDKKNYKLKKIISIVLIIILVFITVKYHFRFNENRKFHELNKEHLSSTVDAEKIHKSLSGLKWKNPIYLGSSLEEIKILNKAQKIIDDPKFKDFILITHYQFFDSISKKNLNAPSKTYTTDGTSMPLNNNKYFDYYKNFLQNKIYKTKVNKILFFKHENIPSTVITNYFQDNCFEIDENEIFYVYKLVCSR